MKRIILFLLVSLALILIFFQAQNPAWNRHLQTDVWIWYERVTNFFQHQSFNGLKDNELLPATLLYVFLPALASGWSVAPYFLYLKATLWVNLLILLGHFIAGTDKHRLLKICLFSILVLAFGPISLFRFDGAATLLVILGLIFWLKQKFSLSGLALGLATGIKIYPVIFLPYLLLLNRKRPVLLQRFILFYLAALLAPVLIFFALGGRWEQVVSSLAFHGNKYVSIESLPASLLTGLSLLKFHQPPPLLAGYGVWGIDLSFITNLKLQFFNLIWLLPVGGFYLYLWAKKGSLKKLNFDIIFCLTLIFLVFSKNLNPQYIWWFLSLYPFLKFNPLSFILLIFICIFNQLVYPLFYTQFLEDFYRYNQHYQIFYCLLLRNLLIVALTVVSLRSVLVKRIIRA
ncbi:DUF2029 domain-containing protein [Patescibacteria group bacterium]|nr:DUF2029 domain-containing protein [Patescibacteria group bacterium]